MTIEELKTKVAAWRTKLSEKSGKAIVFGPSGPADMTVIDALVAVVEAQEKRIAALENAPPPVARFS